MFYTLFELSSKDYDRGEWSFLEEVMRKLGFNEQWIILMMICVNSLIFGSSEW